MVSPRYPFGVSFLTIELIILVIFILGIGLTFAQTEPLEKDEDRQSSTPLIQNTITISMAQNNTYVDPQNQFSIQFPVDWRPEPNGLVDSLGRA